VTKKLNIPTKLIGMAGTKDKRGATCQYVSCFGIHPKVLASLNENSTGWKIGNIQLVFLISFASISFNAQPKMV